MTPETTTDQQPFWKDPEFLNRNKWCDGPGCQGTGFLRDVPGPSELPCPVCRPKAAGAMTTDQQQPQAGEIAYLPWYEAGGPNECEHGYADGIPCPHCDANPKLQALVATVARQAEQIERLKDAHDAHTNTKGRWCIVCNPALAALEAGQ